MKQKKSPTKKETMDMILALEQRVLTLQMFMDAMSKEFLDYLTFKKELDVYKTYKEKLQQKEERRD
tara:strand:+ start:371 stop:568 length:198 start_codon:yes stop_codon:yes gene_type:complete